MKALQRLTMVRESKPIAYFETGYTTSRAEGLNTKARLATRQAYGFHSADAVRAMIELRCTGITIQLPHQIVVAQQADRARWRPLQDSHALQSQAPTRT